MVNVFRSTRLIQQSKRVEQGIHCATPCRLKNIHVLPGALGYHVMHLGPSSPDLNPEGSDLEQNSPQSVGSVEPCGL